MKHIGFCLILFLTIISPYLFGERYSKIETSFYPSNFYVGDPVELKIHLTIDEDAKLHKLESIKTPGWLNIDFKTININRQGNNVEISLLFSSFRPGVSTFPELRFGDVIIKGVKLNTVSLLEEGIGFKEKLQPQLLLPGTRIFFLFSFIIFAAFLLLSYPIVKQIKKVFKNQIKRIKAKKAVLRYRNILNKLEVDLKKDDWKCREFYILLIDELRLFLKNRADIDFSAQTTGEIDYSIKDLSKDLQSCFKKDFIQMFRNGDYVKFNGIILAKNNVVEDLNIARKVAGKIDSIYGGPDFGI